MPGDGPWANYSSDDQGPWQKYGAPPPSDDDLSPGSMMAKSQAQAKAISTRPLDTAPAPHEDTLNAAHRFKQTLGPEETAKRATPILNATRDVGLTAGALMPGMGAETIAAAAPVIARTALLGGAGATLGEEGGSRLGGLLGPTGAKVGGTVGAIGGGLVGGGLGAGLERDPATLKQAMASEPGSISKLPFGMQRFVPEWAVPKGEMGSITNPGPAIDIARDEMYNDLGGRLMRRGQAQSALDTGTSATGEGIPGSIAKPSGRLVLSPEEAASQDRMLSIAKTRASQHGLQYAAGMRPAGGGRVPRTPSITETVPYPEGPQSITKFDEEGNPIEDEDEEK